MKFVFVVDDFVSVFVVSFDEDSGVGLIQFDFSSQDLHQVRIGNFNNFDELGKDGVPVDGDHLFNRKINETFLVNIYYLDLLLCTSQNVVGLMAVIYGSRSFLICSFHSFKYKIIISK